MEKRIENLIELGKQLSSSPLLEDKIKEAERKNHWFVPTYTAFAIDSLVHQMLNEEKLTKWLSHYKLKDTGKTVGLVVAGNIPLVGVHDFICAYLTGCHIKLKLSSKDDVLFPFFIQLLSAIDHHLQVETVEKLKDFDAVIATGSDNTNRYFEYYFRNYPKILRRNRNSVAVLSGNETDDELEQLADDVFLYFGFGCRNVSKLYVPKDYDLTQLFPHFEKKYKWLHQHNKYMSNYDYHRTVLMLNKTEHLANDFIMLTEDTSITSPIATLHYSYWNDKNELEKELSELSHQIQCVVTGSHFPTLKLKQTGMGTTQYPLLSDYADGVDTVAFLLGI